MTGESDHRRCPPKNRKDFLTQERGDSHHEKASEVENEDEP